MVVVADVCHFRSVGFFGPVFLSCVRSAADRRLSTALDAAEQRLHAFAMEQL